MAQPAWQLPVQLLHAINSSDSQQLLSSPAAVDWDLSFTLGSRRTPALHLAVERASTDIVRVLLSRHCSVSRTDSTGNTALHCAALSNRADIVRLLLSHRAKVNAANSDCRTPLHLAALHGNSDVMTALLAAGADTRPRDVDGATALYTCCARGHIDAAQQLLQAGAAVDACLPADGATVLHALATAPCQPHSSSSQHRLVASLVAQRPRLLHATNSALCTPLALALLGRKVALVSALLDAGAVWQPRSSYTESSSSQLEQLLQLAASEGLVTLVQRLLAEGAGGGGSGGGGGGEAVAAACRGGHWQVLQLLLSAGYSPVAARQAGLLAAAPLSLQRQATNPLTLAQLCRAVLVQRGQFASVTGRTSSSFAPQPRPPPLIQSYLRFEFV